MHETCAGDRRHAHGFGQDRRRAGEGRTRLVIALTAATMVVEVWAGLAFGSMALLADGLHMASHTAALGITAFAYAFARKRAHDPRFSFGTGKVNALGGFAGAVLLAGFAGVMALESVGRLLAPVTVDFDHALLVAVFGLAVNTASAVLLLHGEEEHGHDHNLRSAYLHVLADALTSVLAIAALLAGKVFGLRFVDPAMGIVGAVLVARWSVGLVRETARVLLDRQAPDEVVARIRSAVETRGDHVSDLHVWRISPDGFAAVLSVVGPAPLSPDGYRALLPADVPLAHVSVEVQRCAHEAEPGG